MARNLIQVYDGPGACKGAYIQLLNSLRKWAPGFTIIETNGKLIQERHRFNDTILLCFGGGYDVGFLRSLGLAGCASVKRFVQDGGRYLGICAGGYFASKKCMFDKNGPLEVCGPRFTGLFEGIAVGPYFPGFKYDSEDGSYAVPIKAACSHISPQSTIVYFNGGCSFQCDDWPRSKALYYYANSTDAAIIVSRLGDGWSILSGVHFEYDLTLLRASNPNPSQRSLDVYAQLAPMEDSCLQLCRNLIVSLLSADDTLISDLCRN
ncbi:unnamed protein product [Dicrocoelium dendriticum]|nr:unnamed protein product [Dicrocoelium dendriticum]